MIQYTTPTITLNIRGFSIPDNCDIYVSLEQGTTRLEIKNPTVSITTAGTTLTMELTQQQSGQFKWLAPVRVQVNWIDENGKRNATKITQISAFENLLDRVISYGS